MSQQSRQQASLEGVQGVAEQRAVVTMIDLAEPAPEDAVPEYADVPFMPLPGDSPVPDTANNPGTDTQEALREPTAWNAVIPHERPLTDSAQALISAPTIESSFAAVDDNLLFIPPDLGGAAGPNHLMAVHNGTVLIQDKQGGRLITRTLDAFWSAFLPFHNIRSIFDPKILYDSQSGRWIFVACDNARQATSGILIAVSRDEDPTGTWFLWRVPMGAADAAWADFPSVGCNQFWIVFQVNMFVGNTFSRSRVYAFDKADLLRGDTGAFTLFELTTATIGGQQVQVGGGQVPVAVDGTSGLSRRMYLVQNWNRQQGLLLLWNLVESGSAGNPPSPTPALSFGPTVATGNTWDQVAPSANLGPQLGSTQSISLGDDRIHNTVVLRSENSQEFLYGAQTVFLPAGGSATRSAIQLWKIRPDGTPVSIVRIDDPSGTIFYAFPSMSITRNNLAIIGYAAFSGSHYARAEWSYWDVSDPAAVPIRGGVLRSGEGSYVKLDGNGRNRWGDYTSTALDPDMTRGQVIWTLQEYARQPAIGPANPGRWGTWWASFRYPEIT